MRQTIVAPSFAILCTLQATSVAASTPNPPGVKEYESAAMKGDYQAQRNLAFAYATDAGDYERACAWYLLILRSDSSRIHNGDVSNATLYCGRLNEEGIYRRDDRRVRAEHEANALFRKIYGR